MLVLVGSSFAYPVDIHSDRTFILPRDATALREDAVRNYLREHDFDEAERLHVGGRRQGEAEEPELRRERAEEPSDQRLPPQREAREQRCTREDRHPHAEQ